VKIDSRSADAFVRRPDPAMRALLIYGKDEGLVGERSLSASASIGISAGDPFRLVELTSAQLKDDPARLADEFASLSLMGGRRFVRVRPADDDAVTAVENLLDAPAGDALIVLEAGELGPRSPLRVLAETSDRMAAIPCYPDTEETLGPLVERTLKDAGLRAAPDVLAWIVEHVGGDRAQTRSELEKLILYVGRSEGGAKTGSDTIGIDDAMAILGDTAAIGLDDVVQATFDGDLAGLDRALDRVFAEGSAAVQIVRAVQRHAATLHFIGGQVAAGAAAEAALARLRPPVPYFRRAGLLRQVRLWPPARAAEALGLILETEMHCKTTGLPDRSLTRRLCLQLGFRARRPPAQKR
jgi:DNA polymerase-3 subunit delta